LRDELRDSVSHLPDHAARARFVAEHPEFVRPEAVVVLAEWVPKLIRTDRAKAPAIAECAVLIARKLRQPESMALALRAKANLLHVSGKNKAAVRYHDRARGLFARAGNWTQVARTLSASIQPLILVGEYDRAYEAADKAGQIFKEEGNDWRLARVELNTGNIFDRQDRFAEALECYERAYRHLTPHQDQDPEAVAIALHNMAGCLVLLNDFHRAVETYEKARNFAAQNGMPTLVAQADYNIAWLHYLRGEYGRAISLLRTTRDACERSGDRYHFGLCHLDLSEIYLELNMSAEAEEAAAVAQHTFHQLEMRYEEGKASANRAIALSQEARGPEALKEFARARALFLREKNKIWCALLDLYRAATLYKQDHDEEARRLASAALRFFSGSANFGKVVLCQLLLARVALRGNKLTSALRTCRQAVTCLKKFESPSLSCQAHSLMAQIQKSLGRSRCAYDHYHRAKECLEHLRSGIRGDELKISFMRDRVEIYEGLVDICLTSSGGSPHEALGYIEQAKSRSLFDVLSAAESPSGDLRHDEGKARRRLRELREELNWYQHRVEIEQLRPRDHATEQLEQLRGESRRREREILRLLRESPSADAQADSFQPGVSLSPEQIQQALHRDATIVEYFQVRDELVVVLLTHNHLEMLPLGKMATIEALLTRLRFQMAKLRLGAEYVSTFEDALLQTAQNHLRELYQELIAPIRSRLKTSHLVIVPQGALHHLPFHALFDGVNYLVDDFAVSYAPSASIYTLCHSRAANATGQALVLAIPDAAIPLVEEEASAVATILSDAELMIGAGATSAVLAERGRQSRFIHIATHGFFREDQPMFSGIRLADSCVSLYDLYQLRLPAELITLSGCSTGLNVVSAGDEILGLARGLIRAGAQSALLTLWDVQDRSTAEFMKSFYQGLMAGRNKAQATRDAALRLRKSHRHPYYWAPFVLIGKVFQD